MWFLVALFVVGLVAGLLLMPKTKVTNATASTLNDLQFPRAKEGEVVPWGVGRFRNKGPNAVWVGDFEAKPIKKKQKTGLFSSKKVIVGYNYYVGMVLDLCLGPDVTMHRIWSAKDELWAGTANVDGQALVINKPNLYGGKEKGGGFVGTIRFYTGSWSQNKNAYYESKRGAPVPARRGRCYVVLEHVNYGEQNSLRELSFELSRYPNTLALVGGTEIIGQDSNPMAALYDLFTSTWGGLHVSPAMLDTDKFKTCAATLVDEAHGYSQLVARSTHGKDLANENLRQIDGLLYNDPETALIVPRLIRDDYDIATLPIFNETNIKAVRNFASKQWRDTINQVRVTFTNKDKKYENGTAFDQDMSNVGLQGRVRSINQQYPGCSNYTLATTLAKRDLAQGSVPLMAALLETNREGARLRPGDCFIWQWADYRIGGTVMRLKSFDLGALNDNKIAFDCKQDHFQLKTVVFGVGESQGSNPPIPSDPAVAVASEFVMEAPFFFAAAAGIAVGAEQSIILTTAEAADAAQEDYDVYTSTNTADYQLSEAGVVFSAIGSLNTAITASGSLSTGKLASITVTIEADELEAYTAGEVALGAGMFVIGKELFAHEGMTDNGDGTVTFANIWRALLDTAPAAHSLTDAVYLIEGDAVIDDAFGWTESLRVKFVTRTFRDELDLASAPYASLTLNKRTARPAKPRNVKFDGGTAFAPPASGSGSKTVTWANSDRRSTVVRTIVDNTNEYESGQQTVLRYKINAGAWVELLADPGETSITFDAGAGGGDTVSYELFSRRDGLDSFAKWTFVSGAAAGGGTSPDTGGGAPADDGDPYTQAPDSVSLVFPFGETIGTYAIDLPITFAIDIADNFVGLNVDVRTNPADGTSVYDIEVNGVAVGSISITTAGAVTATTTGGGLSLVNGDTISCVPPSPEDSAAAGITITLAGTRVS